MSDVLQAIGFAIVAIAWLLFQCVLVAIPVLIGIWILRGVGLI